MGANDPEHQVPVGNEEPQCIGRFNERIIFCRVAKNPLPYAEPFITGFLSLFMYPIGKVEDTDHLAVREAAGNFQQVVPFPLQGNGS